MANVSISFTTKKQSVPVNPPPSGNVRVQLLQSGNVVATVTTSITDRTATFTGVADGEYTVSAQRMSMQNLPIGAASTSQPFTVVNVTDIDVPDLITVAFG